MVLEIACSFCYPCVGLTLNATELTCPQGDESERARERDQSGLVVEGVETGKGGRNSFRCETTSSDRIDSNSSHDLYQF